MPIALSPQVVTTERSERGDLAVKPFALGEAACGTTAIGNSEISRLASLARNDGTRQPSHRRKVFVRPPRSVDSADALRYVRAHAAI